MIYLKIAHVDDNDCDVFSFSTIHRAVRYLLDNNESEWIMSDIPFEEFQLSDYTYIEE